MEMEVRWVGGLQTCYVSLPLFLVHALESTQSGFLPPVVALELRPLDASTNHQQRWHLAWSGSPSNSAAIEVAHQLGESIGLPDRAKVQIRAMSTLPRAEMARIEPAGEDDWEVLELNSEHAEETILKQLGLAYEGMTFPLWLHAHTVVLFSVTSVLPKRSVVQLVPGTEVVVAPKVRNKNTSSKRVSTTTPSLKEHLLSRVLLRVQDLPKNMIKEAEVNGVKFGVLPTSLAFVHPETTNGLEFSIPQLVILMSRVSRNGSLKGQEDASGKKSGSHNEDTNNASPITGKKTSRYLVVRLLHSDSVAKGHIMLPWSLQFYLGTPLHSWVYVKKYNQRPVEDISSLSLSPFWFRLSQSQESHKMNSMDSSGGQLKDINETNGSRRDYAVGDDLIDWSIHEEFLATVPFLYSEHQPDPSKPLNEEGLFSVWIAKQMNIGASEIGQGGIPSIVVGRETLFHLRIDMNQFSKLHGQGSSKTSRSSAKGCKEESSKIDILFLLTADFGHSDQKSTCKVSVSTDKGQISFAALEKLHGKLSLGKPISLDYVEGRSFNPSFDVALSSLQWMEKSVSETLNRITVILSPWLGKFFSSYKLPFPGHVLIYGPPGSGKTSLASAVAKHFEVHKDILAHVYSSDKDPVQCSVFVSCSKLAVEKLQTVRQGLANCISEALSYSPSLVVFDDLDTVASSSDSEASPVSNTTNSLAEFLADIMDEFRDKRKTSCLIGPVAFIATTQSLDSLPRCLSSSGRLDFHVQLPAPAAEERAAMLKHELHKRALLCSEDTPSLISSKCDGYDAYDLEILVDRAVHAAIGRTVCHDIPDKEEKPVLLINDFLQAMDGFVPVAMRGITKSGGEGGRVGWEDVGGLSEVRKAIQEMIELPSRFPNIFKRAPLRLRSNVLLYGPPGCGKTHIVGAAAAACNLRFISVKGPELLNKYIGASEQAVRDIFSKAAMAAPSLLFFDEFDSIAPKRGHDNTGVTDRVVNQFLTELDGVEALTGVFVFAATSRPDLLDAALLRPGRLDRLLFCDFPSKDERLEILKVLSRKLPMAGNVDLEEVASLTEGFSGADIQALLSDAQLASVHKLLESPDGSKPGKAPIIDHALLKTVALKSRPSVSPSEKQRLYGIYNQFSEAKKSIAAQSRDAKGKRATLA